MMLTRFSVPPLHEVTRELAAVAHGRTSPELVLTGARVLSVLSDRTLPDKEIWISRGRIAAVKGAGEYLQLSEKPRVVFDCEGGILGPGLVDPHIHIESSMITACAYAEAALLNGTTTIFCDSHEIGNVCDREGVEWMLEDARQAPLNIFLTVPSTVPATHPGLETAGGDLTAEKVGVIFDQWPEAAALGEKMDFVPVCLGDERSHAIIGESLKRGKPISGHIYGREFVAAYAASGVTDTHEAIDREIANDFIEAGLWVFLRGGPPTTPWHSLPEAIKAVTELGASPKRVCVCTDDRDADDLFHFGQDWVTRQAIVAGLPREVAWSMGSLHPATRFGMDGELGALGHSRRADIVLLNENLEPQTTWYGGEQVVLDRKITSALDEQLSLKRYQYPQAAYETVKVADGLTLTPELPVAPCKLNFLGIEMPGIMTKHHQLELSSAPASWDALLEANDCCFLTVVERYGKNGNVARSLLKDFGLQGGAVGSSVGHDAHNIILAGDNEADMQLALATIKEDGGGIVVVQNAEITGRLPLPVAGLLSDRRATEVAAATETFKEAWDALGCRIPYMGFNLLPLSVIPELRLTDQGQVAVPAMNLVPFTDS